METELLKAFVQTISSQVDKFISAVVVEQNVKSRPLDKEELRVLWYTGAGDVKVKSKVPPPSDESKKLNKAKKNELVDMCKERGLKTTGTKTDLIARLLESSQKGSEDENDDNGEKDSDDSDEEVIVEKEKKTKSSKQSVKKTKSEKKTPPKKSNAKASKPVKKGSKKSPKPVSLQIRRNKFDNFEHPETHFVFDKDDKVVVGKQNDDGTIQPLTQEDVELCTGKYNFEYRVAENLDAKKKDDDSEEEFDVNPEDKEDEDHDLEEIVEVNEDEDDEEYTEYEEESGDDDE